MKEILNRIEIVKDNIVYIEVDAIVNAANNSLLGGGGVDGAIHRAAGIELLDYCKKLNGCKTGEAVVTPGFNLKAKFIIHTVGPVWKDGMHDEDKLLESSYKNCLNIACEKSISSIAFPSISTGIYNFPKDKAAEIALKTTLDFIKYNKYPKYVKFVCFSGDDYKVYMNLLSSEGNINQ